MTVCARQNGGLLFCAFVACLCALSLGVHAQDGKPEIDLWPLFYYDKSEDGTSSVTEVLWPFIEGKNNPKWKESYFRPFWNRRIEKGKEFDDQEILWPFGRATQRGTTKHSRFFPLYFRTDEVDENGDLEMDEVFLPFLFKRRKKGKDYTAIFPFYGHMTDRFGRDDIKFVMWPIYTWQRKGDVTATNVLWPIFSISDYPEGGGLKVWPLFGISEKKDTFKKNFLLWPMYNYQWAKLKKGGTYECAVMPLVAARERSPAGKSDAVMWPFFQHIENFKEDYVEDWFPWPLVGRVRGKDYKKDTFLPFFSCTRKKGHKDDVIVFPLGWFTEFDRPDSHYQSGRVMPFWFATEEKWHKDDTEETYCQVWPFFHTSKKRYGVEKTEVLSPVWLKENGGWDRNWAPFFWLYQCGKDENGVEYRHVLHRVYRRENGKDYKLLELRPLFRIWEKGRRWQITILKGIKISGVKAKKTKDGKK